MCTYLDQVILRLFLQQLITCHNSRLVRAGVNCIYKEGGRIHVDAGQQAIIQTTTNDAHRISDGFDDQMLRTCLMTRMNSENEVMLARRNDLKDSETRE